MSLQERLNQAESNVARYERRAAMAGSDKHARRHAELYIGHWRREAERNRAAISRRG